ncbi:Bifunctional NAD(P)H-hydrate repair enzyme Nnr [Posidoniimonas polymericola]|uniref:NAD(P)H-hydrate epimerase n=1 Tax=Posidoniimonas polymericola TaxID=2528002 RepID=A0A5C5ZF53_9BACT|nr:NAD(P)H-hydrate epimerase [Posidoniimonas polymericola]TWT85808.1 Bifunctional NAD(P)H-hydrate repair enzyme Nnr [Posidoniimonas polymericola]
MPDRYLTREQARDVDRRAINELGYPGPVLMENAGRGCVDVLQRQGVGGPVLVLCGKGNNGGDGFVIARHLMLRGVECRVALTDAPTQITGDAQTAHRMLQPCGVREQLLADAVESTLDDLAAGCDWLVDALLGTGAQGNPRPPVDAVIRWANQQPARRLAIDLPSGLDCETGQPGEPTFRADCTCTLVAPKVGFRQPAAQEFLGQVHTVSIGLPMDLRTTER